MILLTGAGSVSDQLHGYVQAFREAGPGAWLMAELIARKGQNFTASPLSPDIPKGQANQCHKNATLLAKRRGYDYIEGITVRHGLPIGFHHSWCTEPGSDQVIDNTLGHKLTDIYFGIRFSVEDLDDLLRHAHCYGYLQNEYQPNYQLALKLDPTLVDLWPDMKDYVERRMRRK